MTRPECQWPAPGCGHQAIRRVISEFVWMDSTPHPIERHPVQRKKGRGGSGPVTIFNPGGVDTAGTSAIARLSGNNTYSGGTTIGDELSSTGTEVITLNVSAGTKVPFTSGSGRPS